MDRLVSETDPVRVGVVGLGYWGPNLVRNLNEIDRRPRPPGCAICARSCSTPSGAGSRPSARRGDLDEMLEDDSLDAVAVVTPVVDPLRPGDAGARGGQARVRREAPRVVVGRGACDLIRTADERGLVLMPGHTFLYSPPVNRIRDLIRSGELGEIYFISMSRVNLGLHQSDVSVIWDLGPHDFSILLYWLDEQPSQVISMGRACIVPGKEDVAFINCAVRLGDDRPRRVVLARAQQAPPNDGGRVEEDGRLRRLQQRAGARLRLGRDAAQPRVVRRVPQVPHRRHRLAAHRSSEPIALQMEDFCRAIRSGSTPALVGAARARRRAHDRGGGALAQSATARDSSCRMTRRSLTRAGCRGDPAGTDDPELRVLVLTNMYPTPAEPDFGCFVKDQVDDLRALGVDVTCWRSTGAPTSSRYIGGGTAASPGAAARPLRHRARPLRAVRRGRASATRGHRS